MDSKLKIKKYFIAISAIFALLPCLTFAAEITFEGKNQEIAVGEQSIAVKVITNGEPINAVQANIEYDPKAVRVVDIITAKSFCGSGFFIEKNIDDEKGLVTIACIRPGGFTEDTGILAELLVQPLQSGEFSLRFGPETRILAHDGLGTNVLRQATDASFHIADWPRPGEKARYIYKGKIVE